MKEITYFNGRFVEPGEACVSLDDRGYVFGDGVYEVTRVYNGQLFGFSYHQDRLYRSLRAMDIPVTMMPEELQELHEVMIERSDITNGYIYLQITRGVAPRHHGYDRNTLEPTLMMYIRSVDQQAIDGLQKGVKAIAVPDERWLRADIKTLNLIPNILAQTKAEKAGAYTAVLYRDGICTEGAHSNVFAVKGGILYTHEANNLILKGITRQLVINKLAPATGITVFEKDFDENFVKDADELIFTDTVGGIVPITQYEDQLVNGGEVGPVASKLVKSYAKLMEDGLA
ncbi:D-amino-acid transaminase [uncultured Veillonella sp.]|uniref:D-amino-acid transaminase n=1 Tax=uncultured Veillonella sp. TaxID=159268 RepID=UPI0026352E0F|nr:D-amino-acid transaminase [uncultured Veillonella sp.]